MNNRQRIIRTVLCQKVDRLPFVFYLGPWNETIDRWRQEGLDSHKTWDESFGFDEGFVLVNVNLGYSPAFSYEVIEEKDDTQIIKDSYGVIQEIRKSGVSIPRYIEYPVKNIADWRKLKEERLDPDDPRRFPDHWEELVNQYNTGDKIVQLGDYPYGLFGTLRDMLGVETLLVSFYDQPELIREIMDYLTDFWLSIYAKVCRQVKVDAIHMWEDMSGKNGPLISPKMVREFMMPNYKKIKEFADDRGINIFSLDTDGDCSKLIPLFMDCGINLIFPFEVAAGSDIVAYRRQYPNLGIMGGIAKQEIAKGKACIDRELERIAEMFKHSGYIPGLDHLIHPEISWEDFNYFVSRLKKTIGI